MGWEDVFHDSSIRSGRHYSQARGFCIRLGCCRHVLSVAVSFSSSFCPLVPLLLLFFFLLTFLILLILLLLLRFAISLFSPSFSFWLLLLRLSLSLSPLLSLSRFLLSLSFVSCCNNSIYQSVNILKYCYIPPCLSKTVSDNHIRFSYFSSLISCRSERFYWRCQYSARRCATFRRDRCLGKHCQHTKRSQTFGQETRKENGWRGMGT